MTTPLEVRTSDSEQRSGDVVAAHRAVGWLAAQAWGVRLLGLGTFVAFGRLLVPEDFGLVALAMTFVLSTNVLVDRGLGPALVQRQHLETRHLNGAFWSSLIAGGLLTAGFVAAAPGIARLLGDAQVAPLLALLSFVFVIGSLEVVPAAVLTRNLDFRPLTSRRLIATTVGGIVGVGAAAANAGAYALAAQALVTAVVSCCVLWMKSGWRPRLGLERSAVREMRRFSRRAFGINAAAAVLDQSDKLLVGAFLGPTQLGLYTVAQRLQLTLQEGTLSAVGHYAFPRFSAVAGNSELLRTEVCKLLRLTGFVAIPLFTATAVLLPEVLPLLFGATWSSAVVPGQIFSLLAILATFTIFDRSVLLAVDRAGRELAVIVAALPLNVGLFLVARPFGLTAVVLAFVCRSLLLYPVRLALLASALKMRRREVPLILLTPVTVSAVAGGVASAVALIGFIGDASPGLVLVVKGLVFAVVLVGTAAVVMPAELRIVRRALASRARSTRVAHA